MSNSIENVLILQGGGSLEAFGCGVFKALINNNIKIDIIAGTSIGGVNAAINAGSKEKDYPELFKKPFWIELAENSKLRSSISGVVIWISISSRSVNNSKYIN